MKYLLATHDKGSRLEGCSLDCGLLSITKLIAGKSDKQ